MILYKNLTRIFPQRQITDESFHEYSAKYLMQNPVILKKYIMIKLDFLQECS